MTRFAGVRFVQTHIATNPATSTTIFLAFFVAVWCTTGLLTGKLSGWAALARRFGSTLPFPDQRWRWKSARMRWGANYNNCLTIGADPTGLYLSPFFFFRIGHPPLFIPWAEISIRGRRKIMFIECVDSGWVGRSRFPSRFAQAWLIRSGRRRRRVGRFRSFRLYDRGVITHR
jgi:hypothetical protein